MQNMRIRPFPLLLVPILCAIGSTGCTSRTTAPNGECLADPAVQCGLPDASAEAIHLTGYSCTGTARPDENATYIDGVPQGTVCSDEASVDEKNAYCCTTFTTQCSYNPSAICPERNYGYQCLGANRPEAVNPAISCHQGVREDNLIDYCCSGTARTPSCVQSDAIGCYAGMLGWTCPVGTQPTAEDLGANKSRADLYYLLCPVPKLAANPKYETFCCFTSGLVPAGGSCQQDIEVPNCAPGKFGISCYGIDRPEQNFPRLTSCGDGVPGRSEQGYPATVYCCDFDRG